MADGSTKYFSEIMYGDLVQTDDGPAMVTAIVRRVDNVTDVFLDESDVYVSSRHPIFVASSNT
jgi:hypothetical protein